MIRSSFFGPIGLNWKIGFRILANLKKRLVNVSVLHVSVKRGR